MPGSVINLKVIVVKKTDRNTLELSFYEWGKEIRHKINE